MKVVYIERAEHPLYHSLERVFRLIREHLSPRVELSRFNLPGTGVRWKNFVALRAFRRKMGKDVLFHVTGDIHYATLMLPGKRTVLTMHDLNFLHHYSGLRHLLIRLLYLHVPLWKGVTLTAISEATKAEFVKETGCDPGRITVIPNPVIQRYSAMVEKKMGPSPILLFVGSTPNKNLSRVAEALKGMACTLHIIGTPDEKVMSDLSANGVEFVTRRGLTDEEMSEAYDHADIVLFPSLYEGFGLPILEGFQACRPVLTSDLEPMRSVADGAAMLVDPLSVGSIREGLRKLIDDPQLRRAMVEKGKKVVERHDPRRIAGLYEDLYREMHQRMRGTDKVHG